MTVKLIMTAKQIEDRDKWLAVRNKYIGGSEAAIVVGLNKYRSRLSLWAEKLGKVEPENLDDNMIVQFGSYAEDFVAQQFTKETGKKVRKTGLYVNDKYPWACASVDRMIVGENSLLECKTTGEFNKDDWEGDNIPDSYYVQILHYMATLEYDHCYIAVMFGNGRGFEYKRVDYNEADARELMDAEKMFWELVQTETMPEVDSTKNCAEILGEKFHGGIVEPVDLPSEASNLVSELDTFKAQEKELKEVIGLHENRLREILGDHEIGLLGERKITWKTEKGRSSFNTEGLNKEFPDIYKKFYSPGTPKRVLRIGKLKKQATES